MNTTQTDERTYVCPQCGAMSRVDECSTCGRQADADLTELARIDDEVAKLHQQKRRIDLQRSKLDNRIDDFVYQRAQVAKVLRRRLESSRQTVEHPVPQQVPQQPSAEPEPEYFAEPEDTDDDTKTQSAETSTRSVQNVLLTLGGVLSAAAIIVFTAVAWATFGALGRAGILTAITVAMLLIPLWIKRKGLLATAETVSGLAILMIPCDAVAVHLLNIFPSSDEPLVAEPATSDVGGSITGAFVNGVHTPGIGVGLIAVTLITIGYRRLTGMVIPGYAAAVFGVLTIVLSIVQASTVVGVGILLASAATQALASWLTGKDAVGDDDRATGILTQICATIAVVSLLAATVYGTATTTVGYTLLAVSVAVAMLLTGVKKLPGTWRNGPLWTIRITMVAAWTVTLALSAFTVLASLLGISGSPSGPTPPWQTNPDLPLGWRLTATIMVLTLTSAAQLAGRRRYALAIAGGALAVLTLPSTLMLTWTESSLLLAAIAIAIASYAALTRHADLSRALLIAALFPGLMSIGMGLRIIAVTVTVLTGFAVCLSIASLLACLRSKPGSGGALAGAALLNLMVAGPATAHLLDLPLPRVSATGQILVSIMALLGTFTLTRNGSNFYNRFIAYAGPGLALGIAIVSVISLALPTKTLLTVSALVVVAIYGFAAGYVVQTVRGRSMAEPGDPFEASRHSATGMATFALLTVLGACIGTWSPADALPGFLIVALVAAIIAAVLPDRIGHGPARGAWVVGGLAAGVAALAAVSTVPQQFGALEPLYWLDWRTPAMLGVVALAVLALLPRSLPVAVASATLAAISIPSAWGLVWWSGPAMLAFIGVAWAMWAVFSPRDSKAVDGSVWVKGTVGLILAGFGMSAASGHPGATSREIAFGFAALIGVGLFIACCLIAVLAYNRRRPLGGIAVSLAIVLMPISTVLGGIAGGLSEQVLQMAAMTTACIGLLAAAIFRVTGIRYMSWATMVVPLVAVTCARGGIPSEQSGMYVAVASLIGIGAAMLMLPNRRAALIRTALSSVALLSTMVKVLPLAAATLALPYSWLKAIWSGAPHETVDGLTPWGFAPGSITTATGWDLAILLAGCAAIVVAVLGLAGRGWAIGAGFAALAIAIPTVPVVFDLPWPSLPFVTLAIAVASYVLSTHLRLPKQQLLVLVVVAVICAGTGLSGSLAAKSTTLTALTVISVGTLTGAIAGADKVRRSIGWLLSAPALSGLVTAAVLAAGLPHSRVAFGAVMLGAVLLALASARTTVTGPSTWAAETGGHGAAIFAVVTATAVSASGGSTVTPPAVVLVIYGALLGLLAVRANENDETERLLATKPWYAAGSVTAAFISYWLLLAEAEVSVIEVYTVPFALATLLGGWLELRRRPKLRSWTAYGPGLSLLLLPPLAQILLTEDEPWRRLGLGVASIVILLLGVQRRAQAPVVVAAIMLTVQAIYEITLLWTLVPSWLPLAIAGIGLLSLGATFERRRRDVRRLREALATMR